MIERFRILESVEPVMFYGVNTSTMQLFNTLFTQLRTVARGNVMKVIGDEDESELFLKKIREVEKYCEEFNSLSEDVILDIIKGKGPTVVKQENLIIHGMNGKPITARTENQQLLVKAFENINSFNHPLFLLLNYASKRCAIFYYSNQVTKLVIFFIH